MKYYAILNNYQIGSAELRATATDKIVQSTRLDKYHTKVVWKDLEENERRYIIMMLLGRKEYRLKEIKE